MPNTDDFIHESNAITAQPERALIRVGDDFADVGAVTDAVEKFCQLHLKSNNGGENNFFTA